MAQSWGEGGQCLVSKNALLFFHAGGYCCHMGRAFCSICKSVTVCASCLSTPQVEVTALAIKIKAGNTYGPHSRPGSQKVKLRTA